MTGPFSSKRRPHSKRVAVKVLRHWSQGFKKAAESTPERATSPSPSWIILTAEDAQPILALDMASTSCNEAATKVAEQLGYTPAFAPYLLYEQDSDKETLCSTIVGVDVCAVSPGPMGEAYDAPLPHDAVFDPTFRKWPGAIEKVSEC